MITLNGDIRLSACERCRGDTYLERSDYPEWRCLQCGGRVPDSPKWVQISSRNEAIGKD